MDWEEKTQIALYNWFRLRYREYTYYWHHSPNGGRRDKRTAAKFKAMGTQKGFPDVCIFLPTQYSSMFALELKTKGDEGPRAQKGKVTHDQVEWLGRMKYCRAVTHVAWGFQQAKEKIEEYMEDAIDYEKSLMEKENGFEESEPSNG